jgi:hypothetical protein
VAKKRKEVKIIEFAKDNSENELNDKPSCFGNKCDFCKIDICGEYWYNICEYESN